MGRYKTRAREANAQQMTSSRAVEALKIATAQKKKNTAALLYPMKLSSIPVVSSLKMIRRLAFAKPPKTKSS